MNPNTRKRHNSTPKCDQCPDTRNPGEPRTRADRKADKNRLFTPNKPERTDNMRRIDHDDFKTYVNGPRHTDARIRVPRARAYAPRQCMPDGFTIQITRKRAAQILREMRLSDKKAVIDRATAWIKSVNAPVPTKLQSDNAFDSGVVQGMDAAKAHAARKESKSGLDKAHAALVRKAKRNLGLEADNTGSRSPCNAVRKASARTRKGKKVQPRVARTAALTPTITLPVDTDVAARLYENWFRTSRKLTFPQYCDRWIAQQTG